MSDRWIRYGRLGAVTLVVVLMVAAYLAGAFDALSSPQQLKRTLLEAGPYGYLVFLLAYALTNPFGGPGSIFIWAAPLIWPWPVAYALSMTGTMMASVIGFTFARFVARDWVSPRIPQRFKRYDQRLEESGLSTVVLLRMLLWMPALLHAFFGVSKVSFSTHFWGSLLGYALPLFLVSFYGEAAFDALKAMTPTTWVLLGVAGVALWFALRAFRRRRAES